MARLSVVFGTLLRTRLRQLAGGSIGGQGGGLALIVGALLYGGQAFTGLRAEAAFRIALGETHHLQRLLTLLLGSYLLAPLLLRGGGLDLDTVVRLRRFPMTLSQACLLALAEILSAPLVWAVLAATLASWPLLAAAPQPGAGRLGFVLFAGLGLTLLLTSHTVLTLLGLSRRKRGQGLLVLLVFAGGIYRFGADLRGLLPQELVLRCLLAPDPKQALLALAMTWVLALGVLALVFVYLYREIGCEGGDDPQPLLARKHAWVPTVRGRWGTLVQSSMIFCYHGVEPYLGLLTAVSALAYLLTDPSPELQASLAAVALLVVCHGGIFLNLFGHEGKGLMRLQLMPSSGRWLLLLKNASVALVIALPLLPLLLVILFRQGAGPALTCLLAATALTLVLASWGNLRSVLAPRVRSFFASQRPLLTGVLQLGVQAGLVLAVVLVARLPFGERLGLLVGVHLGLSWLYRASLVWGDGCFERMTVDV